MMRRFRKHSSSSSSRILMASKKSALRRSRHEDGEMTKVLEGHLRKSGKGVMSNWKWKTRFFRLIGGPPFRLQYFRKEDVRGQRRLRQYALVPGTAIQKIGRDKFRISFPNNNQGRKYLDLSGRSEKDTMVWITTIASVIEETSVRVNVESLARSHRRLREENRRLAQTAYRLRAKRHWRFGTAQIANRGRGYPCEDRVLVADPLPRIDRSSLVETSPSSPLPSSEFESSPLAFIVVADGHAGSQTAEYVVNTISAHVRRFLDNPPSTSSNVPSLIPTTSGSIRHDESYDHTYEDVHQNALASAFARCEDDLRQSGSANGSGACVSALLLTPTVVHVANVGDCRVVALFQRVDLKSGVNDPATPYSVSYSSSSSGLTTPFVDIGEDMYEPRTVQQLTKDHKPNEPSERARISRCGGVVMSNRLDGVLAVSRSIGDFAIKDAKPLHQRTWSAASESEFSHTMTPSLRSKTALRRFASERSMDGDEGPMWARDFSDASKEMTSGRSESQNSGLPLFEDISSSEEEGTDSDDDSPAGMVLSPYFSHSQWEKRFVPLSVSMSAAMKNRTRLGSPVNIARPGDDDDDLPAVILPGIIDATERSTPEKNVASDADTDDDSANNDPSPSSTSAEKSLSSVPDVLSVPLLSSESVCVCIIVASDGLWDVFDNEEALNMAHDELCSGTSPEKVAESMVHEARKRDSEDDITVVIIDTRKQQDCLDYGGDG